MVFGKLRIIEALIDDHEQRLQMTERYNCRRTMAIGRQLSTTKFGQALGKGKRRKEMVKMSIEDKGTEHW